MKTTIWTIQVRETVVRTYVIEGDSADEALRSYVEAGVGECIHEDVVATERLTNPERLGK